jgi:cell division protein ZapA
MDNNQRDEPPAGETIRVSIFDQIYSLRSSKGSAHIRQIAQVVDERMRQIAMQTTTFELSRIAVLAALNLADELEDFKSRGDEIDAAPPATREESGAAHEAAEKSAAGDEANPNQTWFDAIFDAEVPVKERSQRLSSQISSKLQNIRQDNSKESPAAREAHDIAPPVNAPAADDAE